MIDTTQLIHELKQANADMAQELAALKKERDTLRQERDTFKRLNIKSWERTIALDKQDAEMLEHLRS